MTKPQSKHVLKLRKTLLAHYDVRGRALPWRIRPKDRADGAVADPYKIWLSEIMCQQTTVTAVTPYWHKFLAKWPSVNDLANAPRDEVLAAWAGLGYYARARNLHKCAGVVANELGCEFPNSEQHLLTLPGIGPYSAAAIASICFGAPTNVVDGNVERVISRLYMVENPLPKGRAELREHAGEIASPNRRRSHRNGDYGQALMDLGSQICKPKNPKCEECPWSFACLATKAGVPENYPKKIKKQKPPNRYGAVFYLEREREGTREILLQQRPDKGLLGGMMQLPTTDWTDTQHPLDHLLTQAPYPHNWQLCDKPVKHIFTHFTLHLKVFMAQTRGDVDGIWANLDALDDYALPSLMRKAIEVGRTG